MYLKGTGRLQAINSEAMKCTVLEGLRAQGSSIPSVVRMLLRAPHHIGCNPLFSASSLANESILFRAWQQQWRLKIECRMQQSYSCQLSWAFKAYTSISTFSPGVPRNFIAMKVALHKYCTHLRRSFLFDSIPSVPMISCTSGSYSFHFSYCEVDNWWLLLYVEIRRIL